jgi:hypothetical protein
VEWCVKEKDVVKCCCHGTEHNLMLECGLHIKLVALYRSYKRQFSIQHIDRNSLLTINCSLCIFFTLLGIVRFAYI